MEQENNTVAVENGLELIEVAPQVKRLLDSVRLVFDGTDLQFMTAVCRVGMMAVARAKILKLNNTFAVKARAGLNAESYVIEQRVWQRDIAPFEQLKKQVDALS